MTLDDPIARFADAFARAKRDEPFDATAMSLATVDADGTPSVRMVLLKSVDLRGFVFFTNHRSRKGKALLATARAALCVHWPKAAEQVRVEGRVGPIDDAESDAYFASRPRGSQVGAWASDQSEPIPSREALEAKRDAMNARFGEGPIPRPAHWGGFRVVPTRIEFWKDQPSRLHDRDVFTRALDGTWAHVRLQP